MTNRIAQRQSGVLAHATLSATQPGTFTSRDSWRIITWASPEGGLDGTPGEPLQRLGCAGAPVR